jgi:plasmid maintenance system antidote protein VapI
MSLERTIERYRKFVERAHASPFYWHEVAVDEFIMDLHRLMEEQHVSRAELARRIGTSRAYITKLLGGDANFTLMTMVKLAMALGGAVHVHISDQQSYTTWQDKPRRKPSSSAKPTAPKVKVRRRKAGAE